MSSSATRTDESRVIGFHWCFELLAVLRFCWLDDRNRKLKRSHSANVSMTNSSYRFLGTWSQILVYIYFLYCAVLHIDTVKMFRVCCRRRWYVTLRMRMKLESCTNISPRRQSCSRRCFQSCKISSFQSNRRGIAWNQNIVELLNWTVVIELSVQE